LPVHDARDRILLEGEEHQLSEDELDNEVFALPDVQDPDQQTEEEVDEGSVGETPAPVPPKKIKPKKETSNKITPAEPAGNASEDDRENGQEESWGRKKSIYYSTNAAQIDSDDEEAQKLEEAEVLRLQAQARDALDEADFGLFDAPALSQDTLEVLVMQYAVMEMINVSIVNWL
jgi:U3 small nucleolar RNA-associated protein 3